MKVNEIIEQCNELLEDKLYFLQTIELTKDEVKVLLDEIERLKELINDNACTKALVVEINKNFKLQQRIDKAINYLDRDDLDIRDEWLKDIIIEILKGGDPDGLWS